MQCTESEDALMLSLVIETCVASTRAPLSPLAPRLERIRIGSSDSESELMHACSCPGARIALHAPVV